LDTESTSSLADLRREEYRQGETDHHQDRDTMPRDVYSVTESARFPTTAWTVLEEIKQSPAAERAARKNQFIVRYWKPVFRFLRGRGYSLDRAEELTQDFFAMLLEEQDILGAKRENGRFRTFLLTLLKRFLSDQLDPARRRRQESFEDQHVSIGSLLTDDERCYEPVANQTAEDIFMRQWAAGIVVQIRQAVKELYEKRGQAEWYELFRLTQEPRPGEPPVTQEELGARFGLKRDGVKYRLSEVKQSFLVLLRARVKNEVGDEADIDAEIGELLRLLSQ
jgi:DNA-directed RNA polymerase specialized sigma24 family protein